MDSSGLLRIRPALSPEEGIAMAVPLALIGELYGQTERNRRSTTLIRRSKMNPTKPIVRMHRIICS